MVKGHSSSVHPDVPNKKDKTNWVEEQGGLPSFIKRVAKHIKADSAGMTWSHAIAAAVSQTRKMKTPEAKKAIAQWDAMRARARSAIELSRWREALHPRRSDGQFSDKAGGSAAVRGGLGGVPKGALRTYESQTQTRVPAGGSGALKAAQHRATTPQTVGGGSKARRGGLGGRKATNVIGGNTYTNEQLTKAALERAAGGSAPVAEKVDRLGRMLGLNLSPEDAAKAVKVYEKTESRHGTADAQDALLDHLRKLAKKRRATPYSAASAAQGTGGKGPGTQTRISGGTRARELAHSESESNNNVTTGNLDQAQYSQSQRDVTPGLSVVELATRQTLKERLEAERARRQAAQRRSELELAISRTREALDRAKPDGAVADRMKARLESQTLELSRLNDHVVELSWKEQPRYPKGHPKGGQWIDAPGAKYSDFKQPTLTAGEKNALLVYGAPHGYKTVNPYLHTPGKVFDSNKMAYADPTPQQKALAQSTIKELDTAFAKAVPTTKAMTIFRRTDDKVFGPDVADKIGHTFVNKSYTSTAAVPGASSGNGYGYETKNTLWEIHLPAGTKALQGNDFENEIILPRNGQFTVAAVEKMDNGTTKVKLAYAPSVPVSKLDTPKAPAAKAPSAPIKKNSVEYWERARDKTIEARDKAKPGGKIWQKMEDRRIEQQKMIDHMKASNKTTLTEAEWEEAKANPVDDAHLDEVELDEPVSAKKSPNAGLDTAMHAGKAAAANLNMPTYVYKDKYGTFKYAMNQPDQPKFAKVMPDGTVTPSDALAPTGAIPKTLKPKSVDEYVGHVDDYYEAQDLAEEAAKLNNVDMYAYKDGDDGFMVDTKPPVSGKYIKFAATDGGYSTGAAVAPGAPGSKEAAITKAKKTATAYNENVYVFTDPVDEHKYVTSSMPPFSAKDFTTVYPNGTVQPIKTASTPSASNDDDDGEVVTASDVALKLDVGSLYVYNAQDAAKNMIEPVYLFKSGNSSKSSMTKPEGVPYAKAAPDGTLTYHGASAAPSSQASPTAKVPTTADAKADAKAAKEAHKLGAVPAPDMAAGPSTPFEWPNAATREVGVDALHESLRDAIAGTPEADAIKSRFMPNEKELAEHYRASKVKTPGGARAAVRKYTGQYYSTVNNALRGKTSMTPATADSVQAIDSAMAAYATAEPMIVQRGVHSFPAGDMVGKMIRDPGYMSTALASTSFGSNTRLNIFVPAGTHGVSVDGMFTDGGKNPGEKEFILPRGTMLLISKDESVPTSWGGTQRHLTATVVPVPKDAPQLNGPVDAPGGMGADAYTAKGLDFLRINGRAKWAARYANGKELALSRPAWYNRLNSEKQRRMTAGRQP